MEPTPANFPSRCTAELRRGRISFPGETYFLTLCEGKRRPGLAHRHVAGAVHAELETLLENGDFHVMAAVVMPDHVHFLGTLGERLSLSRTIGRLKAKTGRVLRAANLKWQDNFHDHCLRAGDTDESFAHYIFLNPYRARLIATDQRWDFWWRWGDVRFQFEKLLADHGTVPPEWLNLPKPAGMVIEPKSM